MLFAYPVAATAENWLHECLAQTIREGMSRADAGRPRLGWPDCIAAERRERLRRFSSLEERLDTLLVSYEALDPDARCVVRGAMEDQAALADLFNGARRADRLEDLPDAIRTPAHEFFAKAFEALKPLGIRDQNYKTFIHLVPHKVCAFCGAEHFSGVSAKREPLDHYLPVSMYPFAGANARNLVPMGPRCNSSYKLAQDLLRDRNGVRRTCFDPYAVAPVRVDLSASRLFARENGLPDWHVHLDGDAARIETWDAVFEIRSRFADHLDSIYKNAIKVYGTLWAKRPDVLGPEAHPRDAFGHLADLSRAEGWSDRAFLKTALYELLRSRCDLGGDEADRIAAEFGTAALVIS